MGKDKKWKIVGVVLAIIYCIVFIPILLPALRYCIAAIPILFSKLKYWIIFDIVIILICRFVSNFREKMEVKKIERETLINNIDFEYYRDIINEYSPAVLSFIHDGLEEDKDLIATIIYLIDLGYLELTEDNQIIRTNKDTENLPSNLQFFCGEIKSILTAINLNVNKKYKKQLTKKEIKKIREPIERWKKIVVEEVIKENLATSRDKLKKTEKSMMKRAFGLGCLPMIMFIIGLKWPIILTQIPIVIILIVIDTRAYYKNEYIKTQKGYELYKKIIGLKKYIKDYSNLSESSLKEIAIWKEFSIYAIIFNEESKLNDEAFELCKRIWMF